MKQSLSRARTDSHVLLIVAVTCATITFSCARQQRRSPSATELSTLSGTPVDKPTAPRLNINTATAADLGQLPGVGNILAERIVSYRQQSGPFRRAEHLMMVHGFSDHKFRALRELITVE
ncbi:MAG TPA: helix-hairpin-helix domain-containing protein [Pyrinomonadaceae bacterium]|nr:helix-hairpin-helix domain-containing protein [Pyrinomonadaceae bacterium]